MPNAAQLFAKLRDNIDSKLMPALGNVKGAVLRRPVGPNAGDRPCKVVLSQFTPIERMGGLIDAMDIKAIVSAKNLTVKPEMDKDFLVIFKPGTTDVQEQYRITARPSLIAPDGVTGIVWELQVRAY